MKKYNTPVLEVYKVKKANIISTSTGSVSIFPDDTTSTVQSGDDEFLF